MKACFKKLKLLHCLYNTEFRIYSIYTSGPPSEEKNPQAQDQPTGLLQKDDFKTIKQQIN